VHFDGIKMIASFVQ